MKPSSAALSRPLPRLQHFCRSSPCRLQVVPWLVLWLCGCEVVFQEGLDVFKGRPFVWLLLPALQHHFVEGLGAALRAGHPVASFYLLQDLSVHHACRNTEKRAGDVKTSMKREVTVTVIKMKKIKYFRRQSRLLIIHCNNSNSVFVSGLGPVLKIPSHTGRE